MTKDEKYMRQAITQAKKAYAREETPIGCVIVYEDKIIARGYNKRNLKKTDGRVSYGIQKRFCMGSCYQLLSD